jgi:hypothetical protein
MAHERIRTAIGVAAATAALVGVSGCADTAEVPTQTITETVTVTATPSPTPSPPVTTTSETFRVQVSVGRQPLANATVQLYAAQRIGPLTVGVTDLSGTVTVAAETPVGAGLYLTTRGGQLGEGRGVWAPVELVTLLGAARPSDVVIDERTTVAAAYAASDFVAADGQVIATDVELDAAATAAANLVDPVNGQLAAGGQDQQATINTLAQAVTACSGREPMCQALTFSGGNQGTQNTATTFAGLAATARDPSRGSAGIFAVQQGFDTFTPTLSEPPAQFVLDY